MDATNATRPAREWPRIFLRALAGHGNVTLACQAAGIVRSTAYRRRGIWPRFAAAWDRALFLGTEALEDEAKSRAFDRLDRDSARLLVFLLKGLKPDRYRDAPPPAATPSIADLIAATEREADSYLPDRSPTA